MTPGRPWWPDGREKDIQSDIEAKGRFVAREEIGMGTGVGTEQ